MLPMRYVYSKFVFSDQPPGRKMTISYGENPLTPEPGFHESHVSYINPENSYVTRFDCGYTHKPAWFAIRNRVLPRMLFKYCLSGRIICNGMEMAQGDAVFVDAYAPFTSEPQEGGTEVLWCVWEGDIMQRVIEQLRGYNTNQIYHLAGVEEPLRALFAGVIYNRSFDAVEINRYVSGFTDMLMAFLPTVERTVSPLVKRAMAIIDGEYRTLSVEALAAQLYVDPCHLARAFRRELDLTPKQYLTRVKLTYAEYYLTSTPMPIAQVAEMAGYANYTGFYLAFKRQYGMSPEAYRRAYAERGGGRRFIPREVRIAAYIVIISGFVTTVELLLKAYLPEIDRALGLFIPLIVVNCIILARAEAFASKNGPLASVIDGLAMGLGFTLALILLATIREVLGSGSFYGIPLFGENFRPATIFVLPAGAFLGLGFLIAAVQKLTQRQDALDRLEATDPDLNEEEGEK